MPRTDPNRCQRGFVGNTIGQANAVTDKALDLRYCNYEGASLRGKTLSGESGARRAGPAGWEGGAPRPATTERERRMPCNCRQGQLAR